MELYDRLSCFTSEFKESLVNRMDNKNIKNLNRFKALFGDEGLQLMIKEFPGVVIRFPSTLDYNKEERNTKIKDAFYDGKSVQELAKELMLSESRIRTIINKR